MRAIWKHLIGAALISAGSPALADLRGPSVNFYGVPGIVDMPTAFAQPDGELTFSLHGFGNGTARTAIGFQLAPRLQAVFRYSTIPDVELRDGVLSRTYDRSFDLRFLALREGRVRPAVTIGLQDFGGTGIYSSEYVVASKTLGDFTVTGGIGWGRLGTEGSFDNPFGQDDRPVFIPGETGGELSSDSFFRGPAALFGGVTWQASDRLRLKAEWSSDAYTLETGAGIVDRDTSLNFGLDYQATPNLMLTAAVRHGTDLGLGLVYRLNPKRGPAGSGIDVAPQPVLVRPPRAEAPDVWGTEWIARAESAPVIVDSLRRTFTAAGLDLQSYQISARRAQVRFINPTYESQAQAIGRAARAMTRSLPASIETFEIVPLNSVGQPGAAVVVRRSDVEALENSPDGAAEVLAVAGIVDAVRLEDEGLEQLPGAYPRFAWAIGPSVGITTFDPDSPARLDVAAQVSARYTPRPGLVFSGAVRQRLFGNVDDRTVASPSGLPRVRTNSFRFAQQDDPFIPYLTAEWFARPAPEFYSRVTLGLIETQYGGVSTELLWKPATGPLALGVEYSRVRQRDFDQRFGFRDLDASTAFVTAYLNHGGGFHSQLAVGQYLAGDKGATYTLSRRFANGFEVGAFATKTDATAEDFGEGSFDKGIVLRIPLAFVTGYPSREAASASVSSLRRDGGARLRVRNRLYGLVSDQSGVELTEDWGRFWR